MPEVRSYYVVKDPLKDSYFELDELEHSILDLLKVTQRYQDILRHLEDRFSLTLEAGQVQDYLEKLFALNLVKRLFFGSGFMLANQNKSRQRQSVLNWALGWLSIKLPGFYPGRLISFLSPIGSVLFSRPALAVLMFGSVFTFGYAILNLGSLALKVPHWQQLLSPDHFDADGCGLHRGEDHP